MPMVGVNVDLWSLRARAPKLTRCVRELINELGIQRPRQRRGRRAGWRVRHRRHAYADATATTDSEIGLLLKAKPIPVHVFSTAWCSSSCPSIASTHNVH